MENKKLHLTENEEKSGAPEGKAVPSPLVAPLCITLIKTPVTSDGRGEGKGPIF